jgi:type VI secretion system secreted protein Hcp
MAFDAFLKFTPVVKGESTDKVHAGEIEIMSFSWGVSNPVNIGSASGGMGAGKASLSSFNLMKKTDAASPSLFKACCSGSHYTDVTITLRKAGGTTPLEYLVYVFKTVFVESIQWSGSTGGDDTPTESVSLGYGSVQITYKTQDAKGGAKDTLGAGWDQIKNVAA